MISVGRSARESNKRQQCREPDQRKRPAHEEQVDKDGFGSAQEDDETNAGPKDGQGDDGGVDARPAIRRHNGEDDRELLNERESPRAAQFGRDRVWFRGVVHDGQVFCAQIVRQGSWSKTSTVNWPGASTGLRIARKSRGLASGLRVACGVFFGMCAISPGLRIRFSFSTHCSATPSTT